MDWRTLLFSFRGRINRAKYWLATLIYTGAWLLFCLVAAVAMSGIHAVASSALTGAGPTLLALGIIIFVGAIWSSFAVTIKRLHDREMSGWLLLLLWGLPGPLNVIAASWADSGSLVLTIVIGLISVTLTIWGFVEIACLKGTTGPNAYGADPLEVKLTRRWRA